MSNISIDITSVTCNDTTSEKQIANAICGINAFVMMCAGLSIDINKLLIFAGLPSLAKRLLFKADIEKEKAKTGARTGLLVGKP